MELIGIKELEKKKDGVYKVMIKREGNKIFVFLKDYTHIWSIPIEFEIEEENQ